jgi:hypothetical protein
MTHYAKVNNGIVEKVIVAEAGFFDTFVDDSPGEWVETSYTGDFRKNYAGVGYTYDTTRDAFIPQQSYNSWTLNETTCQWEAPSAKPDGVYTWDETTTNWKEVI